MTDQLGAAALRSGREALRKCRRAGAVDDSFGRTRLGDAMTSVEQGLSRLYGTARQALEKGQGGVGDLQSVVNDSLMGAPSQLPLFRLRG